MIKVLKYLTTAITATVFACFPATANVITVEYAGFSQGSLNVYQTLDGTSRNAAAGMFDLDVLASDVPWITPNTSIQAFCIELDQYIITGSPVKYTVQAASSFFSNPAQIDAIGRLYTSAFDSVTNQTTSTNRRLYSSAFQLAMWELVYDFDAIDLLDNRFVTDSRSSRNTVRSIASTWLSSLNSVNNNFSMSVLQSDTSQDLIIAKKKETAVSTPSTVVLIVLACLIVFGWRFKG